MPQTIPIRANGDANSQVTDEAKGEIIDFFESYGVGKASSFLFHHYKNGEYVAVSYKRKYVEVDDWEALGSATGEICSYHRNKRVNENCVWIHREWIDSLD